VSIISVRAILSGISAVLALTLAAWLVWPSPVLVDVAVASNGPLKVTVSDEAKTRVRHIYTVSAPLAGTLLRVSHPGKEEGAVSLHVGDTVLAGETVVAVLRPAVPGFLDIRSREELQSAVAAAEASVRLAEAEIGRIQAGLDFANSELARANALAKSDTISARNLDKAAFEVASAKAALSSAQAQLDVRRNELAFARARLIDPATTDTAQQRGCCVQVVSPVSGRVLRIMQESEKTIQPGTPILELGDVRDLEIVADLLTADAVQVRPGAEVTISGWGGSDLRGKVNRVEPAAFTKISALGIEEQRVRTIIDFAEPSAQPAQLGHDFRVNIEIVTWQAENTLVIPVSAVFRSRGGWAVFVVDGGKARLTPVKIGRRTSKQVQVLEDLNAGESVILHPNDRVGNGTRVKSRAE
jgi:HlyD family secretion protein